MRPKSGVLLFPLHFQNPKCIQIQALPCSSHMLRATQGRIAPNGERLTTCVVPKPLAVCLGRALAFLLYLKSSKSFNSLKSWNFEKLKYHLKLQHRRGPPHRRLQIVAHPPASATQYNRYLLKILFLRAYTSSLGSTPVQTRLYCHSAVTVQPESYSRTRSTSEEVSEFSVQSYCLIYQTFLNKS